MAKTAFGALLLLVGAAAETELTARLVDDYLSGCEVFCDADGDGALGDAEVACTSNLLGRCDMDVPDADAACALVMLAGEQDSEVCYDVASLLPPALDMKSYGPVVSALSTVSAALVDWEYADSLEDAEALMVAALPALAECEPSSCDPVGNLDRRSDDVDIEVLVAVAQAQAVALQAAALIEGYGGTAAQAQESAYWALADEVYGAQDALDFASEDLVGDVVAAAADDAGVVAVAAVVDAAAETVVRVNEHFAGAVDVMATDVLRELAIWTYVSVYYLEAEVQRLADGSLSPSAFLYVTNATALEAWGDAADAAIPNPITVDPGYVSPFGFGSAVLFVVVSFLGCCVFLCVFDLYKKQKPIVSDRSKNPLFKKTGTDSDGDSDGEEKSDSDVEIEPETESDEEAEEGSEKPLKSTKSFRKRSSSRSKSSKSLKSLDGEVKEVEEAPPVVAAAAAAAAQIEDAPAPAPAGKKKRMWGRKKKAAEAPADPEEGVEMT